MIKFFSRIIAAIGNVISTGVRILKKLAGTRGQRVRYGEELPPRTDSITPPPPPPRLDGQLPIQPRRQRKMLAGQTSARSGSAIHGDNKKVPEQEPQS